MTSWSQYRAVNKCYRYYYSRYADTFNYLAKEEAFYNVFRDNSVRGVKLSRTIDGGTERAVAVTHDLDRRKWVPEGRVCTPGEAEGLGLG